MGHKNKFKNYKIYEILNLVLIILKNNVYKI